MSDSPQGAGWWLASDGRYYPPEQHPDYQPPAPLVEPPTQVWSAPPASTGFGTPPPFSNPGDSGSPTSEPSTSPPAWGQSPTSTVPARPDTAPNPWYFSWWAIVPALFLCFPVGLVLLWLSRKPMGAKVGASLATALLVILLAVSSGSSKPNEDVVAEGSGSAKATTTANPTTTEEPTTTTAPPTTAPPTTTTAPPTTAPPTTRRPTTTAPPTTADPFANETPSQRNARRKGADYLEFQAFSRSGLIQQLEFEGFSNADATYGADSQFANWNEQAAKKAQDYLDFQGFSRSGLIDQLLFEGFSQAEAEYGVSKTGL